MDKRLLELVWFKVDTTLRKHVRSQSEKSCYITLQLKSVLNQFKGMWNITSCLFRRNVLGAWKCKGGKLSAIIHRFLWFLTFWSRLARSAWLSSCFSGPRKQVVGLGSSTPTISTDRSDLTTLKQSEQHAIPAGGGQEFTHGPSGRPNASSSDLWTCNYINNVYSADGLN